MDVRQPVLLEAVRSPGAVVFAILFAFESLARAIISTVIPLEALRLFGDSRQVSILYVIVGVTGVASSFIVPLLVRRLTRRYAYTLGAVLLAGASALLATSTLTGQVTGMALRVFAVAAMNICVNLYILDYIGRRDFVSSEPLRALYSAGAWTLGPGLGVWLWNHAGHIVPYAVSAIAALLALGYFWLIRVRDNPALTRGHSRGSTPLHHIGRFFAQPRLRLSYALVMCRSAWWSTFFIYAPIYCVTSGLGEMVAGLVVSAGNALLFISPAFAWHSRRNGIRVLMIASFAGAGALSLAVAALQGLPWTGLALLLLACVCLVGLDSVGNVPFLRAVRRRNRAEMTTVFGTYRDVGDLAPPALFSMLLRWFDLGVVFAASGLWMLGAAAMARFLPKQM